MVTTYEEYLDHIQSIGGQIWLRIDVDTMKGANLIPRLKYHCQNNWSKIKRIWYIRHNALPKVEDLIGEEVGLHISEPRDIVKEYTLVSEHLGRQLISFTRHGGADGGRMWDDDKMWPAPRPGNDLQLVKDHYPWMVDYGKMTPHHTIDQLLIPPRDLRWEGLWGGRWSIGHVLFHPEYMDTSRGVHFDEVMDIITAVNRERLTGKRVVV